MKTPWTCCGIAALALLAAACGGGGGANDGGPQRDPPPVVVPAPISFDVAGRAVVKVQPRGAGLTVMEQRLTSLTERGPARNLEMLDEAGHVVGRFDPPAGWSLVDFAVHPAGDASVVLATDNAVRLMRVDASGTPTLDTMLVDPQAADDPFFDEGGVHDDCSLVPFYTRDASRVAALGDDLLLVLRTGRNAVVAYRLQRSGASYTRAWRTLVEPGLSMFALGITSGSFDTYGQLANHWQVRLDADASGRIAVAVPSKEFLAPVFARHAQYFHENPGPRNGVLVTRLSPAGERLGTSIVDTVATSELQGLRVQGDDVVLVGRVFTQQRADGSGWDGWFARLGFSSGALAAYRTIDIDRGEALFDVAALPRGRFLVCGASGYTQNPTGASVSEQADPLLIIVEADGTVASGIAMAAGPRQNVLMSLAQRSGAWSVAGLRDGPGTHSGDADPSRISADGLVRPVAIPP
jgi:hypothetical protein